MNMAYSKIVLSIPYGQFVTSVYRKSTFSAIFTNYKTLIAEIFKICIEIYLYNISWNPEK